MIKVVDFKPGHLDFFQIQESPDMGAVSFEKFAGELETLVQVDRAAIRSIISPGNVLAIVGIIKLSTGVVECFAFLAEGFERHAISLHKNILRMLEYVEKMGYHRIQLTVVDGFEKAEKWAKSLGFEKEGLMRGYDLNKKSHYLYARVKL